LVLHSRKRISYYTATPGREAVDPVITPVLHELGELNGVDLDSYDSCSIAVGHHGDLRIGFKVGMQKG
jgi:hypothetical protein